jgi:predicted small secreted protein
MRKLLSIALTLAMLAGTAGLLSACNTTAGAGQDISNTGTALKNAADRNK